MDLPAILYYQVVSVGVVGVKVCEGGWVGVGGCMHVSMCVQVYVVSVYTQHSPLTPSALHSCGGV